MTAFGLLLEGLGRVLGPAWLSSAPLGTPPPAQRIQSGGTVRRGGTSVGCQSLPGIPAARPRRSP